MTYLPPGTKVRLTPEGAERLKRNEQTRKAAVFGGAAAIAASMFFDGGVGIGIFGTAVSASEGALVTITALLSGVVAALSVDRIQQMEGKVVNERISKFKSGTAAFVPGAIPLFIFTRIATGRGLDAKGLLTVIDVDWQFKDSESGRMHYLRRSHLPQHLNGPIELERNS
jgi:hypothetical protein